MALLHLAFAALPLQTRMRILLLQLKRIGDGILTAPAVAALRARHPSAEIVAIVPQSFADLFGCIRGLDKVLAYRSNFPSPNLHIWASLLFGEWDLCYDFTGTDRSALMAWLSRAKRIVGYAKFASATWRARAYTELCDASVRDLHTVDFHLALMGGEPIHPYGFDGLDQDAVVFPSAFHVVVHVGTAREEKFWLSERWVEVIHHLAQCALRSKRCSIVLTGTNAGLERPHLDRLRSLLKVPVTDLTGQLSLVQLAALIQRCELALGVDSMAMHLAALFEKPQVVLFGPTNPFHWRPRHARAVVLQAGQEGPVETFAPRAESGPMELISTPMVLSAIHRALPTLSCPSPIESK